MEDCPSDAKEEQSWRPAACILPATVRPLAATLMAAQNFKSSKQAKPLQASSGRVKQLRLNPPPKVSKAGVEHMTREEDKENDEPSHPENMETSKDDDVVEETSFTYQAPNSQTITQGNGQRSHSTPYQHPHYQPRNPPQTKLNKNGMVQELVPVKSPKLSDPIRGLVGSQRFAVEDTLRLPITVEVGQFLDKSDIPRQELALSMQRSTPRYRVRNQRKRENPGRPSLDSAGSSSTKGATVNCSTSPRG